MGNSVPPFFVFPRVYFIDVMLNGAPPGSKGTANPSGWMTSDNFTVFLKHFTDHVKCTVQSPVLLLLDNHDSHISVASIEYAKNNGIVMLTFPPHCSHKLQPLDRSVYGPLKRYYNSAYDSWMLENPAKCTTIMDIAGRVGKAFPQATSPVNIQSGFRVSGIKPFNGDEDPCPTDDEFLSSYVTDRPSAAVPWTRRRPSRKHTARRRPRRIKWMASSSPGSFYGRLSGHWPWDGWFPAACVIWGCRRRSWAKHTVINYR